MKYFLGAVTITLGLVCWQSLAKAQSVLDLSTGGIQRAPLEMGLITAEEVENPAVFGFKPGELQPGNRLILLPGGQISEGQPLPQPRTTLPQPIQVVPDGDGDGVTGAGIRIFLQSF